MNHTRFPKDNHLPDWARQDNKVTKGDRVQYEQGIILENVNVGSLVYLTHIVCHFEFVTL